MLGTGEAVVGDGERKGEAVSEELSLGNQGRLRLKASWVRLSLLFISLGLWTAIRKAICDFNQQTNEPIFTWGFRG